MFWRFNLFTIIWALLIAAATLLPIGPIPAQDILLPVDKIIHSILFAILMFLSCVGFAKQFSFTSMKKQPVLYSVIWIGGYGLIIELIQAIIPSRAFELMDLFADFTGLILGYIGFFLIYKLKI
jgi:VanZ family protein